MEPVDEGPSTITPSEIANPGIDRECQSGGQEPLGRFNEPRRYGNNRYHTPVKKARKKQKAARKARRLNRRR